MFLCLHEINLILLPTISAGYTFVRVLTINNIFQPDPLANNLGGVDEVVEDGGVHSLQGSRPEQIEDSVGI